MKPHLPFAILFLATLSAGDVHAASSRTGFELETGDRIVLIGDTLIERDQRYGYLETLLTVENPLKNLSFRNLGWSGDTVAGLSRAGFDPPAAGFQQLVSEVHAAKPTVLIVGYGMAESFDGTSGLPHFIQGLTTLLDALADTKARVVLLSPIAHAKISGPSPNPTQHNADLERYTQAIESFTRARGLFFVDLFHPFLAYYATAQISDNGIHLNERGYRVLASEVIRAFAPEKPVRSVQIALDASVKVQDLTAGSIDQIQPVFSNIRFRAVPERLPLMAEQNGHLLLDTEIILRVIGLPAGRYELTRDGQPIQTEPAQSWAKGVRVIGGPDLDRIIQLRRAINRKNQLFFDRWRPQNITYLFGFRKHEQGRNAIEIPQFDPLVADQESVIARLCKPIPHAFELTLVESEVTR